MKMLVSDYDGTFANSIENIKLNGKAVYDFIKQGNIFVLSSGRSYSALTKMVRLDDIPYTFLACSDGDYLFDSSGEILLSHRIGNDVIDRIAELAKIKVYDRLEYSYEREYSTVFRPNENLSGVSFVVNNLNISSAFITKFEKLKKEHSEYDYCCYGYNGTSYFVVKDKGVSKSSPILYLQDKLQVPTSEVFTVGDELNDLEMISDYNGFMIGDNETLRKSALGNYEAVHYLVDDIIKGRVKRR